MGKKPSVGRPKGKNVLAKALSGQQHQQQLKAQQARAEQAAQDRAQAAKNKIVQQGGPQAKKKRRLLAASTNATKGGQDDGGDDVEGGGGGGDADEREKRALERKKRLAQPFRRGEKVLLVGEGNFSFAHSLLLPLSTASAASTSSPPPQPLVTPSMLLCTSFDSHKVALEKYPDLESHLEPLRSVGATILFDVDATKLELNKKVMEFCGLGGKAGKGKGKEVALEEQGAGFDKIVFNFPHVGQGITDQERNIRTNQTLLLDFYLSASHLLRRGTSHLVSTKAKNRRQQNRSGTRSPSPDFLLDEDQDQLEQLPFLNNDNNNEEDVVDANDLNEGPPPPPPPPPSTRGTILLTLRTNPPYSLWLPSHLATKPTLLLPSILPPTSLRQGNRLKSQPTYKTCTSWDFEPTWFEGYEHRRTLGWDEKKSFQRNQDLKRSAKERIRLGQQQHEGEDEDDVGRVNSKGKGKGEDKKEKGTGMRTWQFELVVAEYDGPARDSGWGGRKKRKAEEEDEDDYSD